MLRLRILITLALTLAAGTLVAGELEREIRSRWLGAWVVTGIETRSDCSGAFTNNRVHGKLVKSGGAHAFAPGELAKVNKINVQRSRIDVHLLVSESLLLPWQDGPFTLFNEASCRLELEVVVPKQALKGKDIDAIDASLAGILDRFATLDDARNAASWNGRVIDAYPRDYEQTLAEHGTWRAEQTNLSVQAQLDRAMDESVRFPDRFQDDPDYVAGLVQGIEDARAQDLRSCERLLAIDLAARTRPRKDPKRDNETDRRRAVGYEDGKRLVRSLAMIRDLPGCFVSVPDEERTQNRDHEDPGYRPST